MRTLPWLLLLAACTADGPAVNRLLPELAVAPAAVDFGERTALLVHEETLFLTNSGRAPLEINLALEGDDAFSIAVAEARLGAGESLPLPIVFQPATFLDYSGTLVLTSNDEDDPRVDVDLAGAGVPGPLPDILLSTQSVDFGEVDGDRTEVITVRNVGTAPLQLGTVAQAGSGAFELLSSPSNQVIAPQNELPIVVRYAPPTPDGDSGKLTIPSDDPDESSLEVVLLGNGGADFPYPVARIDCPGPIDPPSFVPLDGSDSSDPEGHLPLTYAWRLVSVPEDLDGTAISAGYLTSPSGDTTRLWADAVGPYEVELVVTNALGVRSAPARCAVEAVPAEDLLIELTWNTPRADLDLHLARNAASLFHVPNDVSYCNRRPSWGSIDNNPRLDLDDRGGHGPENISVQGPADGDLDVRVHYFDDAGDDVVTATVRVYIEQVLALQASKNLARDEVWEVATVRWPQKTAAARADPASPAPRRQCPP